MRRILDWLRLNLGPAHSYVTDCPCWRCENHRQLLAKLDAAVEFVAKARTFMGTILVFMEVTQSAISALRKEVEKMTTQGDQIQQELTTLEQKVAAAKASADAAKATSDKIVADVEALLAKVNGGGGVTAAELQAILDHATTIGASVDAVGTTVSSITTQETAEDQKANPVTPAA